MKKKVMNTKNKYYLVGYYKSINNIIENKYNIGATSDGYLFKNSFNYNLKVGDLILIPGVRDFNVGIILEIKDFLDENDLYNKTKYKDDDISVIFGKIDVNNFINYDKKLKRKEELEKIINEKYEKISKIKILEQMCKDDNELTALLKEFKELDNKLE